MERKNIYLYIRQLTFLGFLLVGTLAVRLFWNAIPNQIYIPYGETVSYDFGVPVTVTLKEDEQEVFTNFATEIPTAEQTVYTVTCRLFGLFPVKDVEVMVVGKERVYASGEPVGIYAKSQGVLVVGTGNVTDISGTECRPADKLVKSGDYIVSVNGEAVTQKEELIEKINAYGAQREILGIQRKEEYIEVSILPVESSSGNYLLGIWVRDDLAGVGTLTYYREDGSFGALGHAISDGDTGELFEISEGYLYTADIVGIHKGERGTPGELAGVIDYREESFLGNITDNTILGIHGVLEETATEELMAEEYEVAYKQDVRTGAAFILSSVSGEMKSYEIQIENLDYNGSEENKGILFQVTDPELLELTGGIVQGMSGSPIIQSGRLVGAVTHVFVSDSAMGYGIFIEKMLNETA
jgi:stage IV sporulation protein B